MIAYVLENVGPQSAASDKRMARLHSAGPWQYQMHLKGALATWRANGPVPRTSFGEERRTVDGLIYYPPKILPTPEDLLRPAMVQKADLVDVVVSQDSGTVIRILPAYMTPRQIMDDNTVGDSMTVYGRAVRKLLDRMADSKSPKMLDFAEELAECCRLAIMYSYRMTRELLTDVGWLNEESLPGVWRAAIDIPKTMPVVAAAS